MLASCGGSNSGKPISEMNATTGSDSASYFYGQLVAGRYDQMRSQDSVYRSPEMQKAYWEGIMKGLGMLKEGDSDEVRVYNEGLAFGLQIATMMQSTSKDIPEYKFNKKMFQNGFWYTFAGDSIRDIQQAENLTSQIMGRMEQKAMEAKKAELEKAMAAYASKHGFSKNGNIFAKTEKPGNGPLLVVGDSVLLSIGLKSSTGKDLSNFAMRENPIVLGKTLPMEYPYMQQLLKMKSGEQCSILMSPADLFGQSAAQLGLKNDEFLIVTLTPVFKAKTSYELPKPAPGIPEKPAK